MKTANRTIWLENIGSKDLSRTTKMPCASYSLSAFDCHTGSKLAKVAGSVCSGCYATRNNYRYPSVKNAHARRLESISGPEWVPSMIEVIRAEGNPFFRWHDSGDLQSAEHLTKIAQIARALPMVRFWLPTKEYKIVTDWVRSADVPADLRAVVAVSDSDRQNPHANLIIRVSAPMIDGEAPKIRTSSGDTLPVSYVHKHSDPRGMVCEAYTRSGSCGFCRACWNPSVNVSYPKH